MMRLNTLPIAIGWTSGYLTMAISLLDVKASTCMGLTYLVLSYFATKDRLSHRETNRCLNAVKTNVMALSVSRP